MDEDHSVPANQDIVISEEGLNKIPPEDIIQEIAFFGELGGGCGKEMCECEMFEHSSPALFANTETVEFLKDILFQVCELRENQLVTVTVDLPNQTREIFSVTSSPIMGKPSFMVEFSYTPTLSTSPGLYNFTFSGDGWEFNQLINVIDAIAPRLYLDKQGFLTFYKFQPNERIRLLVYRDGTLIGWTELQTNKVGTLSIQTTIAANFIAIGDLSGQVFYEQLGEYQRLWSWLEYSADIYCSGAPKPIGIKPFGYVEILTEDIPVFNYSYENKDMTYEKNLKVEKGTIATIKSNAICYEGSFFWSVCIDNNCEYIPESNANGTYLRPTTELPAATQSAYIAACPGTLPSRLSIGMNAEVTTSGMASQLSLRSQPSMSAEKVHVIAAGRDMVILDGPVCADGSYWWYIRSEQGFEGWSREGDNEDYWIDPLP